MLIEIIQDAADALRADPYFSNIPVLAEDLGDPANAIDTYLTKRGGIGVMIMTPKANVTSPNLPGPYFEGIIFIASVWENVALNRAADGSGTGKAALAVAEVIAALLHHHSPAGIAETLTPLTPTIALVPRTEPYLAYNILYKTEGGVDYQRQTVADVVPTVVDNGDGTKTVSLACATPWAYIFFTTDGSYPAPLTASGVPRNPYSVSFTVTSPATLLCRAWLPGYLASKVLKINI
jgi:hypothetical protein